MSLWDYFKQKGPFPDLQSIFHCKCGSHVYMSPGAIPSRVSVYVKNPIIAHNVSITLAPWPSIMLSQAGLLNSAYLFVWGSICKTRLNHCLISHWIQSITRF